jgi:hypothetical protein
MRKVALLSDYLDGAGGTEYYTTILAIGLKRSGNDVRVYTGAKPRNQYWIKRLAEYGIECFNSGMKNTTRLDRGPEASMIATLNNDVNWLPDIVHANHVGKMAIEWILKRSNEKAAVPMVATDWTVPSAQTRHWYQKETKAIS